MTDSIMETLEECREYFDQRADAELDVSGYTGNEEMRLLVNVDAALTSLKRIRNASGILTEGGDAKQAPSDSLSSPTLEEGDAQPPQPNE